MVNPALGECYTAVAQAGGRDVRLRVEYTQTGWRVRVVETDGGTMVADDLANDPYDLAAAKRDAEEIANSYLADEDLNLPTIDWHPCSRQ